MDYKDFVKQKGKKDHAWYRARRDFLFFLAQKHLSAPGEILEVGCGTGYQLEALKKFGSVKGLDLSPEAINIARNKGFKAEVLDLEKESLGEAHYSAIFCLDVLEHLEKDREVLNKIKTALIPRGYLFLTLPAGKKLFGPHDLAMGHKRRYNKKELEKLLAPDAWEILEIAYWNSFFWPAVALMRLGKKIFASKKKTPETEAVALPSAINYLVYKIMRLENNLKKKGFNLPFGLSLYAVARKK